MIRACVQYNLRNILRRDSILPSIQTQCKSSSAKGSPVAETFNDGSRQEVADSTGSKAKLPQRKPLVKNLMLGVVDKELLRYPEVISRDDTSKLDEEIASVKSYFNDTIVPKFEEFSLDIPKEVKDNLKNLGLYSFSVPKTYGGRGYTTSELSVASEPEQISVDIATSLMAHRVVSEVIAQFGTDNIREKYLPRMVDGSIVASEAIFESQPTENQFFGTTAEYNESDKVWTLNGEKSFVINAQDANLFLVVAQVNTLNRSGNMEDGVAVFLVDSTLPGVKVEAKKSFGIQGARQGTIQLRKVTVAEENMLGEVSESGMVTQSLLKLNRLKSGLLCTGMLKNIIKDMTHHATFTKQNGVYLKDMKHISDRLARLVCSTYAIESMSYLTTGLLDEFQDQDVELEAAILKLYALESLWKGATNCMNYLGPKCLEAGQPSELYLRNAAQLCTQNEPLDSLRIYIGLSGIQYAGMNIHEVIRKDRNPLFYPMHVLGRLFEKQSIESPKLTLHLEAEVHPSLDLAAKCLEQSVLRLREATETLLSRFGSEIVEESVEAIRISECMTLIYATFASLARSSRSYCIGLRHSDYELLITTILAIEGSLRVKELVTDIVNGPYMTSDQNNQKIAKQLFKSQKYFYEHPIKYNF